MFYVKIFKRTRAVGSRDVCLRVASFIEPTIGLSQQKPTTLASSKYTISLVEIVCVYKLEVRTDQHHIRAHVSNRSFPMASGNREDRMQTL